MLPRPILRHHDTTHHHHIHLTTRKPCSSYACRPPRPSSQPSPESLPNYTPHGDAYPNSAARTCASPAPQANSGPLLQINRQNPAVKPPSDKPSRRRKAPNPTVPARVLSPPRPYPQLNRGQTSPNASSSTTPAPGESPSSPCSSSRASSSAPSSRSSQHQATSGPGSRPPPRQQVGTRPLRPLHLSPKLHRRLTH